MTCAYLFAGIAFISAPEAIRSGSLIVIVSWIAQTFLQLVLLSIIIVGQGIQGARTEARDCETHDAVMAEHAETQQILADVLQLIAAPPTTPKD
jgi:hypothetical protein